MIFKKNDILRIGVIVNNTLFTDEELNFCNLIERVLDFKFMNSETYNEFLLNKNIVFIYFITDGIIYSSPSYINPFYVIEILNQMELPFEKVYEKKNFFKPIEYDECKCLNYQKITVGD